MAGVQLVNNYNPPPPPRVDPKELLTPKDEFDVNFMFPVPELESDKLKLVPFIPWLHLPLLHERCLPHPEMFTYLPFGPFPPLEQAAEMYGSRIAKDPGCIWFCVVDKTRPAFSPSNEVEADLGGAFAGLIGLLATSREQSQTELGFLLTLPEFQRTHVTTHACGLLMRWVLDPPSRGGLGLRRLQWKAHFQNEKSIRAAERLGFKREGELRWLLVLPEGKVGLPREGERNSGRHTVVLSVCWDDWEGGGRERIEQLMARS